MLIKTTKHTHTHTNKPKGKKKDKKRKKEKTRHTNKKAGKISHTEAQTICLTKSFNTLKQTVIKHSTNNFQLLPNL